jgi:3-oxoacyl-[acyl-carrier protein] reductase
MSASPTSSPGHFPGRFAGQVAVVTGAGSGLGKAIALRLAAEGAHVVAWDRAGDVAGAAEREIVAAGGRASPLAADIADEAAVEAAMKGIVAAHGRLDVLVNSAGVVGPTARTITSISAAELDAVYRVNLRGSFLVTKHALPSMLERRYGRILLIASVAGKEGNAGMSPYSATKAAVIGLVKSVGKEFAESGVTINGLAPAVIRTPMVDEVAPEQVKYMTDKIPMKRCGTLAEVAALVGWIVSPEASFNTGFTFDLSGGRVTY